ncbi:hypothetical protein AB6G92_11650 [Providencia vermicola]|uniref:hypothetical protein n=1 Tax=Providencia vermicola TaxID=333965 RepID=UPI0034DCDC5C
MYIIISIFVLIISSFLFKRAAGTLSIFKPNLISYIFYYNIIIEVFLASILVILYFDNHYIINRVGADVRFNAWLSVMYMMIAFPIGMLLSKSIFLKKKSMKSFLEQYVSSPILITGSSGNALKYSIWCFTIISTLSCLYTFLQIGYYPFLKAITSSSSELASIRISVSRNFSGDVYIRNFFALIMMPILSYVWLFYYIANKKTLNLLMTLFTVFLSVSILYYNFSKSPLLWYILSFIFVYYYGLGKFKILHLIILITIVIISIIIMYSIGGVSSNHILNYNTGPIGRVILSQAAGLYIMFDIFPNPHDFIGFSSISQFLSDLFDYEYVDRAARIAMTSFNPRGVEDGTAGVMNSIFIAEAWANFGILGVLLSPLWVGFIIQTLYIFFLKRPKNPLYLAFFVSFSFGGSITGGFNDYIYNPGLLMMIILFLLIISLAAVFKKYSRFTSTR